MPIKYPHRKILISACLLGQKVRYDAKASYYDHPILRAWKQKNLLIPLCPEMEGGLPTPRPASEIVGQGGGAAVLEGKAQVLTKDSQSNTASYMKGARKALELAKTYHVAMVILKARSPSCGNEYIYDGTFKGNIISGQGTMAALLMKHGFKVFNEAQLEEAVLWLRDLS